MNFPNGLAYPKIAIPSYQRATLISEMTLKYLHSQNYNSALIYIFVASEAERAEYAANVPRHLYAQIVVGILGLKEQRKFISEFFPENEIIVQMDDDVKGIKCRRSAVTGTLNFHGLIMQGVTYINNDGVGLWGVMPNDDGRKMRERTTRHLSHILGSFFIIRNHRNITLNTNEKEDFERSILYFKRYGAVARYNGAGVDTKFEKEAGGLQQVGRHERKMSDIAYIMLNYQGYVKSVIKPKGMDIILNWRARPANNPGILI